MQHVAASVVFTSPTSLGSDDLLPWFFFDTISVILCSLGGEEMGRPKPLLTTAQAAQLLRVAQGTVLTWLREKRLRGYKLCGRLWRIDHRDLAAVARRRGRRLRLHTA